MSPALTSSPSDISFSLPLSVARPVKVSIPGPDGNLSSAYIVPSSDSIATSVSGSYPSQSQFTTETSSNSSFPMTITSTSSMNNFDIAPFSMDTDNTSFGSTAPSVATTGTVAAPRAVPMQLSKTVQTSQRPVAEFLFHLTRMLTDPSNHHLIEWDAGRIVVHDPPRMETEVLAKYFRHSKYSSFQRQLNYFGFRKISGKGKMSPCSYVNDAATADMSCLLTIKRKTASKGNKDVATSNNKNSSPSRKDRSKSKSKSGGKSKKSKSKSPSKKKGKKSKHSSNSSRARATADIAPVVSAPAPLTTSMEHHHHDASSWVPSSIGNSIFGEELTTSFDPFVVSAEEFGAPVPGASEITPSTSASSSTNNLVALGGGGTGGGGAETLCLPPPVATVHNATSALESSFRDALNAHRATQQVSEEQQGKQDHIEITPTTPSKYVVPNPLMGVPNPLAPAPVEPLPSPTTVAALPVSMPSPATAAMYAANRGNGSGIKQEEAAGSDSDLSSGFPVQPALSKEAANPATATAQQAMSHMLSTTIPSASALFNTANLPSCSSLNGLNSMLSPNSSLVNLAMLPTMPM